MGRASSTSASGRPNVKRLLVYRVSLVRDGSFAAPVVADGAAGVIASMEDAINLLTKELLGHDRERLVCLYVNARHRPIGVEVISIGTLTASLAHPREIFTGACLHKAAGIILAHNHPSGDSSPSDEDVRLTKRIAQAGHIMGIDLLDHIIVAESGAYSFKASGAL